MILPEPIQNVVNALARLPGIGPKTASRLAFYLLRAPEEVSRDLAEALVQLKSSTSFCPVCFNIMLAGRSECEICASPKRDAGLICVVEEPHNIVGIETTRQFQGRYHVLQGALSPLRGIGPEQLRIKKYDLSCLQVIGSGGAILSAPVKKGLLDLLPHVMIFNGWGSSETGAQGSTIVSAGEDNSATFRMDDHTVVLNDTMTRQLEPGEGRRSLLLGGKRLREGDVITLDANGGRIFAGEVLYMVEKPTAYLEQVARWKGGAKKKSGKDKEKGKHGQKAAK